MLSYSIKTDAVIEKSCSAIKKYSIILKKYFWPVTELFYAVA